MVETVTIALSTSAYTKVGDGITALTSNTIGHSNTAVWAVVVTAGATAPLVGTTNRMDVSDVFEYSGTDADVYMLARHAGQSVQVIRA